MLYRPHPHQRCLIVCLCLLLLVLPGRIVAQCNNWNITAQLISGSTCAANGGFSVTVSGPDAPNMANLQYAIPLNANGFSVPLNGSSVFSNIPPGTYQVSALGQCGGTYIGKNTTITIPGSYEPPVMTGTAARGSFTCLPTGSLTVYINRGRTPYTTRILNAPLNYTGPTTFTSNANQVINALPAGNYSIQIVDACNSGTPPRSVDIPPLTASTLALTYSDPGAASCDTLIVDKPGIVSGNVWSAYNSDPSIRVSAGINGVAGTTPLTPFSNNSIRLPLLPGKTIKDCYGKSINYTIKAPCIPDVQGSKVILYPYILTRIAQNCNISFRADLEIRGCICYPITYTVRNSSGNIVAGPLTSAVSTISVNNLPLGNYTFSYTTGDGYTDTYPLGASPITGFPYSISVISQGTGLHNYIEGFQFTSSIIAASTVRVELFNGPAGYSSVTNWNGGNIFFISENQTPSGPGTRYFPAGNYVWKVTDSCGSYYLPITVGPQDMYQYAITRIDSQKNCQGMMVYPTVAATHDGQTTAGYYGVLKNNIPYRPSNTPPGGNTWPTFSSGTGFMIEDLADYTILTSASPQNVFYDYYSLLMGYPNPYTVSKTFTYTIHPVAVDVYHTQGFVCQGAGPGQAYIYVVGSGGMLAGTSSPYTYRLAWPGSGATGPFRVSNTTGIFSGFGGSANDSFDVRVEDNCGAFAVQRVKILDLQTARLIASTIYVACNQDSVQLTAAYLPNATYSWTGPNGFTSSLRSPVISPMGPQNIGVYRVTVVTPLCSQPVTDSTIITMMPNPPKPDVRFNCGRPASLTVVNPVPGLDYTWLTASFTPVYTREEDVSDSGYTKRVTRPASYRAIVTDTTTGCRSYSDSVYFPDNPNLHPVAGIYSPHLQLCIGDTTILVAQGATALTGIYQWFRNGAPIPGATGRTYVTSTPGNYKVSITLTCWKDTSGEVTVSVVPIPTATISASQQVMCMGDTALLQANTGPGYTYTWMRDGVSIPNVSGASCRVTQGGAYTVVVSNGGCVAVSSPLSVTVNPGPVINLAPSADQQICPGDTVHFSTLFDNSYTYEWYRDGVPVTGASGNNYDAMAAGSYRVRVQTAGCPNAFSPAVAVIHRPTQVYLGNDTVICDPGPFAIPLSVGPGFTQIAWSDGSSGAQVTATTTGRWWVRVTNECGTYGDTINIRSATEFIPRLPDDTVICNDAGWAYFSVFRLLQHIRWSTGDTTAGIFIRQPGRYWVEGTGPCGPVSDTMQVTFCAPVIRDPGLPADSICEGSCIRFSPVVDNYPQYYQWSFPGGHPDTSGSRTPGPVCYPHAGTYPVTLTVTNPGGMDTYTGSIVVLPQPAPRFADTPVVVSYKTVVNLPACANAQHVSWYKDDSLICDNCPSLVLEARNYHAVYRCVVSNGNCKDSCTYKLRVIDIPHDVWLPDAFTPNGDTRNDVFRVITDNPNVYNVDLYVYNRWGQELYISHNSRDGWDGRVNGKEVDAGTYFWMLRYKVLGSDEVYFKKGDIVLIR